MARKTMWAVAGALLAFAPLASAASYGLSINNARTYAAEVITGPNVEIDYDGAAPNLSIRLNFSDTEIEEVDQGDVLEVTITLGNAKFGENVKNSDMTPTFNAAATGCSGRVRDSEGGSQGSSSVTFQIEAADGDCDGTGVNITMVFELPTLEGLVATRNVSATVETAAGGGSGWPDTSSSVTVRADERCGTDVTVARTACTRLERGVLANLSAAGPNMGQAAAPIIRFVAGLTFEPTSGGSANIDLAGGRLTFERSAPGRLGTVRVGVATAAACTTDDPIPAGCYLQSDGREFSIGRGGEGQGELNVESTGDFREGDVVWLEFDGASGASAREMLQLQEDGSMTGSFALNDISGNPGAAVGDTGDMDREEGVVTRTLFYAPNGEDGLRPATFRSRFMVDFDSADVADKDWEPASSMDNQFATMFTVVEDTQHAYAIPELGATDQGNVRIKCEVATECEVYLECDDTAGNSRFAQLGDPIDGRSTRTLNAMAIADELNFGDDGWEGSLSCTVYSSREITVQVMVRSAGTLVNQTYIENG